MTATRPEARLAAEGWENLKPHPLAELFPTMGEEAFGALVASMETNGYDVAFPLVLHEGRLLDGRNRHRAAIEAGVTPTMIEWAGEASAEEWVIAANIARRHLSKGQVAMVAVMMEGLLQDARDQAKANQHRGRLLGNKRKHGLLLDLPDREASIDRQDVGTILGRHFGISHISINRALLVKRVGSDLVQDVLAGRLSLLVAQETCVERVRAAKARTEADAATERQRLAAEERARLEAEAAAKGEPAPPPEPDPSPVTGKPRKGGAGTLEDPCLDSCGACHRQFVYPRKDGRSLPTLCEAHSGLSEREERACHCGAPFTYQERNGEPLAVECPACAVLTRRRQMEELAAAKSKADADREAERLRLERQARDEREAALAQRRAEDEARAAEAAKIAAPQPTPQPGPAPAPVTPEPAPTYATAEQVRTITDGVRWLLTHSHPEDQDYAGAALDALETIELRVRDRG